jgi:hypothetical protein
MSTYINNADTGTVENHAERFGGMFLFLGIALIVLGSIAVLSSVFVTIGAVMFVGGLLMAGGIAELIHAFRARKSENILWNSMEYPFLACVLDFRCIAPIQPDNRCIEPDHSGRRVLACDGGDSNMVFNQASQGKGMGMVLI